MPSQRRRASISFRWLVMHYHPVMGALGEWCRQRLPCGCAVQASSTLVSVGWGSEPGLCTVSAGGASGGGRARSSELVSAFLSVGTVPLAGNL